MRSAAVRSRLPILNRLTIRRDWPGIQGAGQVTVDRESSSPATNVRRHVAWRRAVGHVLVLAGLLFGLFIFLYLGPAQRAFGTDALAYWLVKVPGAYDIPHRAIGSFPYSPPIALIASTFSAVPLWTFLWLWTALMVASLIWIGWSFGWTLVALALPFVSFEIYMGNIHILLAVAVLLGFRHPWTWSFVLLTKFTCGVGLLWFVVRREWRSLAVALGATASLAIASALIAPSLWPEWVEYLFGAQAIDDGLSPNMVHVPLAMRMAAAALLVIWGARTVVDTWTVLVAVTLALPVLWTHGFAVLVGLVAELRRRSTAAEARVA